MATVPAIRIIVLGTGDFALPMFDLLCDTGYQVVALLTQPDRPQGRKQELIPSLIKQSALRMGSRSFSPRTSTPRRVWNSSASSLPTCW